MPRTSREVSTHADAVRPTDDDPKRIPVASNRAPLTYRGLDTDNFHQRWVMDKDDRVAMFQEAGYTFVNRKGQSIVGEQTVNSKTLDTRVSKSSNGRHLFLMELPKKYYNEDQLAKQKLVDEIEQTTKPSTRGREDGDEPDYGKIVIERSINPVKS